MVAGTALESQAELVQSMLILAKARGRPQRRRLPPSAVASNRACGVVFEIFV